jgi:carbamoyltransferase
VTVEYFLSAYLTATGKASLFWQRHDQCVALWRRQGDRVDLVRYWELERLSGLKHHVWPSFTDEQRTGLLAALLATEGLTLSDITDIWGLPDAGDSRRIVDLAHRHRLSVHSLGHLFSCLFLDPAVFRDGTIVALAIDGGPDFVLEDRVPPYWYAGAVVRRGELHLRPVQSPGLIYTAAVMTFGQEPGTLMAATSACPCRADLRSLSEASLLGLTFYGARDSGWTTATRLVTAAADEARRLLAAGAIGRCGENRLAPEEHVRTVVMRRVQQIAEQIAVRDVQELVDEFGVDPSAAYLGMSGGSALNCPTSSLLLTRFGFRGLLCPPCANDGGQALGLGLAGLYGRGVLPAAQFTFPGPYAGPAQIGIEKALRRYEPGIVTVSDFSADRFVDDLEAGPVAWVDGASEIGPRALGHRSLLADPRRMASKDRLNAMKERQWWRPVAPIILEDRVAEWFEGGHRSPYMLEVFPVAEPKRDLVPAIVHLDGTARVQTLSVGDDPRLHRALTAFAERTGVPLLCNTSLNAKGEPIVQTASQAIAFCLAKGVPVVYVEGARIELDAAAPADPATAGPGPREAELFAGQELARDDLWRRLEERGVGVELMALVARAPQLARALDSDRARRKLQAIAKRTIDQDPAWQVYLDHLRSTFGPGGTFEGAFADTGTAEDALMPVVADLMR